jgi:hypothetical protein
LLNEDQKEELYIRTLQLKNLMYNTIDSKFRNDYPNIIFNRIFFSRDLSEIEIKELLSLPSNIEYKWYEKNIIVSALSLSLIQRFDIVKIELLLNFINAFEKGVFERALVGLAIGLYRREHKLLLYPKIVERLNKLQEIDDIQSGLQTIASALNRETYKGCYNRWGAFFSSTDFQVFRKIEQWFVPFYPNNPILQNMVNSLPNVKNIHLLPDLLTFDRHLSHSQKYLLALNLCSWDKKKVAKLIKSFKVLMDARENMFMITILLIFIYFFKTS